MEWLSDFFIDLINYLITGVGVVLGWIIGFFPNSPFAEPAAPPASINLGFITWLIDFPTMILHAIGLAGAILVFYSIRVLARWIKLIRS